MVEEAVTLVVSAPALDDGSLRRHVGGAEILVAFLRLGLTSFGSPVAYLGYFRADLVQRRRWLDVEGSAAEAFAERLRRAVAETNIVLESGEELWTTVSLGLATLRPCETADILFRRADAALYGAKRGGRDRVSLAA